VEQVEGRVPPTKSALQLALINTTQSNAEIIGKSGMAVEDE